MTLKHGDFSKLAENYAKYRPGYSKSALKAILSLVDAEKIDFADIGAGTGIWTRLIADNPKIKSAIAVEPNDEMRAQGMAANENLKIIWKKGEGVATALENNSCDLLSMASSFHWVDFEKGMKEFARVLRPGGRFVALWNPRYIQDNPVLVKIENKITELTPNMKRVSSGSSKFVAELAEKLNAHPDFEDLTYIEGRHSVNLTKEQYIGVWRSVNDIQYQMGNKFEEFMQYIADQIKDLDFVKSTYLTRAWSVRKK